MRNKPSVTQKLLAQKGFLLWPSLLYIQYTTNQGMMPCHQVNLRDTPTSQSPNKWHKNL